MEDLDKVKSGNLQGIRRNDAARMVGGESLKSLPDLRGDDRYARLEPSLKDKLINDQVKINFLREAQRRTLGDMMPEIDELDIL